MRRRSRDSLRAMATPLDHEKYIQLETFKKDGTGVKTPVWVAPLDGKLVVGTDGPTFKVKRVRNNPRVRVAACNASGSKVRGPWYEGTARIADDPRPGNDALNRKYGFVRRAFWMVSRLFGRMKDPVII